MNVYSGRMRNASFACALGVAACALIAAPPLSAQDAAKPAPAAPHFPRSEELRHLKALGAPLLSPDGTEVLFTVTEATADGGKSHLWLAPAPGSGSGDQKARQITFSAPSTKSGERGAQWAPDGTAVYFLARRGEHTQLFRLDLRGGEGSPYDLKVLPAVDESKISGAIPPPDAAAASANDQSSDKKPAAKPAEKKANAAPEPLPLEVGGYAPSPDGKWLVVWGRDPETPGEKKQKEAKADASWVDHELHGTRLYLAALKSDGSIDGALKSVGVEPDVHQASWSPASDRFIAITEQPNGASDLGPVGAAWLVNAATPDKSSKLAAIPPTIGRGVEWRPDGGEIVFGAQALDDAPPGYEELFAVVVDGSGSPRRLTADFDGEIRGGIYAADGSVVAEATMGTRVTPVRIAADGKSQAAPIDLAAPAIDSLSTNRKQTGWVWLAQGGGEPVKLCFAAQLGSPCQPVSMPSLAPANLLTAKAEPIHWKSGSFTIDGLLYMPPGASGKVPLIVDVHGGPLGAFEDRDDPFAAFLLGHGWAILRANPRGSSSNGVKFAAANKNDLGGGDYQDIMAGVDYVLAKYPLDANRMALMGYSYGGEMAGFVEGKTDRFKAIVSGAPVIDQFSEYGTEGDSWYDRWYFGKPWEHMEDALRQSPLAGAAKAKTPFMLIQGESDTTDPLGQSEEMYRALRQEGVPVELVTYPRENHGPLAGGMFGHPSPEPWHGFDARQRVVEFIEKGFATAKP
jgi:dipeptidyl aminopeptidase/acylaminoacyl peptidase